MQVSRIPGLVLVVLVGHTAIHAGSYPAQAEPTPGRPEVFQAPVKPPAPKTPEKPALIEPAEPITLYDALALALAQNPTLQASAWEVRAGEAREVQANTIPNPEIDIRFYRLGTQSGFEDVGRWRVILSEELETGGKRHWRRTEARAAREVADQDFDALRAAVEAEVTNRFVAVLGAQRRAAVWGRLSTFLGELELTVAKLVETGATRPVEVHRAKRQSGLARIELEGAMAALELERARLTSMWGNLEPAFTEALGEIERALVTIPDRETLRTLGDSSPALGRWQAEVDRGNAAVSVAKSLAKPNFKLGFGARRTEVNDQTDYLLDFEIELPIFDRRQGDIREAKFNLERAKAQERAARSGGNDAIAEAYFRLTESDVRRTVLEDDVLPAARATFDAFQLAFESHAENIDELLDARRDVARAESDLIDAMVDYHQALATLEGLVGQPLGELD